MSAGGGCLPTSTEIVAVAPATGVRFIFQGILRQQVKNGWTVTVRHLNCSADIVRYAVVRNSDNSLYGFRINRGRSHANESLIGDTLPLAFLAVDTALKRAGVTCNGSGAILGVTRITDEEPGLGREIYGVRYQGAWSEVWPITMCGREAEVVVKFIADGDGGAFQKINVDSIKLLSATR